MLAKIVSFAVILPVTVLRLTVHRCLSPPLSLAIRSTDPLLAPACTVTVCGGYLPSCPLPAQSA